MGPLLDAFEAARNRDAGMLTAAQNADAKCEGWGSQAYAFLLCWLATGPTHFLVEDVREAAVASGLPTPPNDRAWGAVILRAAKEGRVVRDGYAATRNVRAHRTPATYWKKTH